MPDDYPTRADDLTKAHEILGQYGAIPADTEAYETVVRAIADGIAFGRTDGIAMAAKDIFRRKLGRKGGNEI
jgi:hypothetical protein